MTPSLEIGNGNWAVQSDSLLGYKTINGKYYPREMSVTRATTATRVNAAGLVELVPYNIFEYSEQFDNGYWNKLGSTISANATTAPNGTTTADKVIETATTEYHYVTKAATFTQGLTYTISVYAKAGERNWLALGFINENQKIAWFNLATGVVGTVLSSVTSTSIESVGNGWFRCSATMTAATNLPYPAFMIAPSDAFVNYLGNGTSGLFIWGAQLVEGTQALNYLPTTDRLDIARVDYSLGQANLLLEPQRTNSIRNSTMVGAVVGTPGTVPTNWFDGSFNSNLTRQIVAIGVENGLQYIDFRYSGTQTATGFISIVPENGLSIAATQNQVFSFSSYIKIVSGNPGLATFYFRENTSAGVFVTEEAVLYTPTSSLTRFVGNVTISSALTAFIQPILRFALVSGTTYDFTIRIAALQMELGAYSTSYIPTTSASVTRNADVISRSNIFTNGYITSAGGTWFVDLRNNRAYTGGITQAQLLGLGNNIAGATADNFWLACIDTTRIAIWKQVAGTLTVLYLTSTDTSKLAIKWNGSTADIFVNGVKVVSATAFTPTALETLRTIATQHPYYINSMALYNTPISDTECINLTTI